MQLKLSAGNEEITITDKSDTVMRFTVPGDTVGKLLSVTDVHANTMTLVYDESGISFLRFRIFSGIIFLFSRTGKTVFRGSRP